MRALGSMETALSLTDAFSPLNLVSIARLSDGPSPGAVRQALDALQARRPELRASIAARDGRLYFEAGGPAPIPLQIVTPRSEHEWQSVAEAELNQRLPSAAGPLARCTYLYRPGPAAPSEIVLTLHHTIVDGGSALGLWRELLKLAGGATPDGPAPQTLAPPSEQLFPPRFRGGRRSWTILRFMAAQMADELAYQVRAGRRPPIHAQAHNRLLARRVPAPVTAALVRRCRAERVTVHSALSAALLLAVQGRLYAGRATTLRGITFGNLRPYLRPPVTAQEPGCHIALLRYSAPLAAGQSFWPLARRINQQVTQMGRRGERFAALVLAPMLVSTTNRLQAVRLADIALSYVGPTDLPEAFGGSRLLGLHAFVSNHRLGPEYTATVQLADGELWWDIVYLDTDLEVAQAEAIAGDVEEILATAGSAQKLNAG